MDAQREEERERKAAVRRGTEAVEGEVEMDTDGEGFINLGKIKVNSTTCPRYSANKTPFPVNHLQSKA